MEEGQVRMRSRLEEEEEAKVALMSRIQRLTKLILVSSKNSIPGYLGDVATHSRDPSVSEDDKLHVLRDGTLLIEGENHNDSATSISVTPSDGYDFNYKRSSSLFNDELSQVGSRMGESFQGGELLSGSSCDLKLQIFQDGMAEADQMDLLVEQLKMLAGEIAFNTSSLKRLVEQSIDDPENSKTQIQTLEREIQEKKRQMRILEQRIVESSEASVANSSLAEMQQTVMKLMSQCSEQSFELEIKTADNRILQEQLQNKCIENQELLEKTSLLEQQLASISGDKSLLFEPRMSDENIDELMKKIQSQEIENEKLKLEHVYILEENSGMRVQNQKLSEEASYAKELASAAAVELKNLAGEVTKLSLQNAKLEKELASRERNSGSGNRKYGDRLKPGFRSCISNHGSDINGVMHDDFDSWDLDPDDLKMELHARKQREAALEAALAEKDILEDEYRKKAEESKRRETSLENDLANMWVLVAQLKREAAVAQQLKTNDRHNVSIDNTNNLKANDTDAKALLSKDNQVMDHAIPASDTPKEEPLVARLKARIQEMKEKEQRHLGNGDTNSHVCKVCFESSTTAMLLPCRHFCLCKSCSLACAECPICRTAITDRIFAFT
ncbi:microtubule binding motor protein [Lithospermum erythrorhizon]|uniref:Microtubule binding motor protein n=1 Tax=Lithospermum erythrorhizon TaxID=34254 RepID=A0AAV3PEE2_LITER